MVSHYNYSYISLSFRNNTTIPYIFLRLNQLSAILSQNHPTELRLQDRATFMGRETDKGKTKQIFYGAASEVAPEVRLMTPSRWI